MTLLCVSGNEFVFFFTLYSSQRMLLQLEQLSKTRTLKLSWSLISSSKLCSVKLKETLFFSKSKLLLQPRVPSTFWKRNNRNKRILILVLEVAVSSAQIVACNRMSAADSITLLTGLAARSTKAGNFLSLWQEYYNRSSTVVSRLKIDHKMSAEKRAKVSKRKYQTGLE